MLIAIATTLARVLITHRHLLEWMTAAKAAQREGKAGGRERIWRKWPARRSLPWPACCC